MEFQGLLPIMMLVCPELFIADELCRGKSKIYVSILTQQSDSASSREFISLNVLNLIFEFSPRDAFLITV